MCCLAWCYHRPSCSKYFYFRKLSIKQSFSQLFQSEIILDLMLITSWGCFNFIFLILFISGDVVWPIIAEKDCNGTQQSPIDIVTTNVQANTNLTTFTFTGYNDNATLTEIKNTGTTS